MTSKAQSAANRNNARKSTGPRTERGKARVARNALKHGLNTPVTLEAKFAPRVEALTLLIAGPSAPAELLCCARSVAEAQVDIERIREARLRTLASPVSRKPRLRTEDLIYLIRALTISRETGTEIEENDRYCSAMTAVLGGQEAWSVESGEGMERIADALLKLDRYEKAARARRKRAIRNLDRLHSLLADKENQL